MAEEDGGIGCSVGQHARGETYLLYESFLLMSRYGFVLPESAGLGATFIRGYTDVVAGAVAGRGALRHVAGKTQMHIAEPRNKAVRGGYFVPIFTKEILAI